MLDQSSSVAKRAYRNEWERYYGWEALNVYFFKISSFYEVTMGPLGGL